MNEVVNIFDNQNEETSVVRPNAGLINVEGERAIAETKSAILLAKNFPRDQRAAFERIISACQRESLANGAIYAYARAGTNISGPSIRLAEAIAQNWGNIQYGVRELERGANESLVEAFAWDCETNVRTNKIFTVKHLRNTKQGTKRLTDERDIYELVANNGARRLRACILSVIPGDVVDEAVKQCQKTITTHLNIDADAIKKLVGAFEELGVTKAQIEARIQRSVSAIEPAQFVKMREIYASIKDGMSATADWFEPVDVEEKKPAKASTAEKALAALEKTKKEPAPVKAEVPAPEPEPVKAQEESAQADNATDGLFGG